MRRGFDSPHPHHFVEPMNNALVHSLQSLPSPYVIVSVGIPGSGKTTLLRELAEKLNIIRISPDEIREELTGNQADQSVNEAAWNETYRRAKASLEAGTPVIIDATHAEVLRRTENVKMYRSYGALAVVAIVFNTPLTVAKQRNAKRGRVVPAHVLDRMHRAIATNPAAKSEDFDEIITIQP